MEILKAYARKPSQTLRPSRELAATALALFAAASVLAFLSTGCTQPGPLSFKRQNQSFDVAQNRKVDLLWVVDNSPSMEPSQQKLRKGFAQFAATYLKANWDIRSAVITTDTYLANPAFKSYLDQVEPGLTHSPRQLTPSYGPDYAKLLPGSGTEPAVHDGPICGLCVEENLYFYLGQSQCPIRDLNQNKSFGPGIDGCINAPDDATMVTQCVNTVGNNTVHSGKTILTTMPPQGTAADASWQKQVLGDFIVNVSTGTAGSGSERGMGSVLQMLSDNEGASSPSPFFRAGATRIIVFLSDEDDQTVDVQNYPVQASDLYWDYGHGACAAGTSPEDSKGNCCLPKTVDSYTYTLPICVNPDHLLPVSQIKSQLDAFFRQLDGQPSGSPNYYVASIVGMSGDTLQSLRGESTTNLDTMSDKAQKDFGRPVDLADSGVQQDRGDRYIQLASLVGGGSTSLDIAADDYTPVLAKIGRMITQSRLTLKRRPTKTQGELVVKIQHADGTSTPVAPTSYEVSCTDIVLTDGDLLSGLSSTDRVAIDYQPQTGYDVVPGSCPAGSN